MKLLASSIIAGSIFLSTYASAELYADITGVQVVYDAMEEDLDGFRTFNSKEGVKLGLAVRSDSEKIISFDKDKSKLKIIAGKIQSDGELGSWPKVNNKNSAIRLEVSSEKKPRSGVTKITLIGDLKIVVAKETKILKHESAGIKEKDEIKIEGCHPFSVKTLGKPKWGNDPLGITLEWKDASSGEMPEIAAIRFYNDKGNEIETNSSGSGWGGFNGKFNVTRNFTLKEDTKITKIELDVWQGLEEKTLPVNTTVSLGGKVKE